MKKIIITITFHEEKTSETPIVHEEKTSEPKTPRITRISTKRTRKNFRKAIELLYSRNSQLCAFEFAQFLDGNNKVKATYILNRLYQKLPEFIGRIERGATHNGALRAYYYYMKDNGKQLPLSEWENII